MSRSCMYCSQQNSTPARGANNVVTSPVHFIQRYPVNGKGAVGSLYNARTDNLLPPLPVPKYMISQNPVKQVPICKLRRVNKFNRDNLLRLIDIQEELRVSIILNMVEVTEGTLTVYNYDLPIDRTIRLIHYYYFNQEEHLPCDTRTVEKLLQDSLSINDATHIVTTVRQGIDFVIVIEIPGHANVNEIDCVLESLCEYFKTPQASFLSKEDQQKINGLQSTLFTSMTEMDSFVKNKDLLEMCPYIHQCIYQSKNNFPLSYTMYSLRCFCPDELSNEKEYRALDYYIIKQIEEKLLPLSHKLRRIERFYQTTLSHLSERDNGVIQQLNANLLKVKNTYVQIEKDVAAQVYRLRQGELVLDMAQKELNATKLDTLNSELTTLQTTLVDSQKTLSSAVKPKTDNEAKFLKSASLNGADDDQETRYSTSPKPNSSITPRPTSSIVKPNEINILLVGETGVGKSTFINAFVNYLAFHSFKEAKNSDPIVLIPVSFTITLGDQFEEHKVEFGKFDPNEEHNHSGQSVTQYCKSYIFTLGNNIKLRIIDTPGIGDTRGIEQDNKNIEHILLYTRNLPYLNAICFLLKPNTQRLHALFRSCFTQLFDFLGPNARDNIIFCFTNTRATFYTPGDTAKILKEMLNDLPNDHSPSFAKENTFCFDSESFRYLAIIKAGYKMPFDDNLRLHLERNWNIAVTESNRLLQHLESRPTYEMNKWHSTKHAQMLITLLTRPIVETIRNALRILVLWDLGDKQHMIEMKPECIPLPAWICTRCVCNTERIGNISIVTHPLHHYRRSNQCSRCHHGLDEHLSVFYKMDYQLVRTQSKQLLKEIENAKNRMHYGTIIMTQFLRQTMDKSQNPFLLWLNFFIEGEKILCQNHAPSNFNDALCKRLEKERTKYSEDLEDNDDQISLDDVYDCIEEILKYRVISEQMNVIKESYMKMMKHNEYDVSSQYPPMKMTGLSRHSKSTKN